jgi:CP family cyanate transporter-like MFS transporter
MSESRKWINEGILFGMYLAFGLSWLAYAPLLGQLEASFHVEHAASALLISAISLASALVPMLAGWLGSRLDLRKSIALGGVLCASAVVVPWIGSFPVVIGLRFLLGVGGSVIATWMGPVIMGWFPPRQWALINGFNTVSCNVGITLAMYATLPISERFGWRQTLTGFGCLSAGLTVLWLLLSPRTVAVVNQNEEPSVSAGEVLRRASTWWMVLAFTGPLASYLALNSWLGQHLVEAHDLTSDQAPRLVGYISLVGLPIAPLGGWITTRLGLRRPILLFAGMVLPLTTLALIWDNHPYLWATAVGFAFQLYVSALFTIPMELPGASRSSVGMTMGTILSLSYILAFGSPILVGWLRDHSGSYAAGLSLFAGLSASLAVGGWLLPETGPAGKLRRARASG